ncbi:hypothetical protein OC846_006188 [Tilletia horrida]|uniref:Hydrophobic surface binding protein A n=1 Tax=Tilletia horrida TaxID=155126 RepID=A0AAN6GJY1_9BASI|nr:hypothetical protein OC846_006188 [Tilletia horrida]KAK0550568.1 hypothetical protein OC845_002622 [Tilletia horrida]KAK0560288.1 hypothetical protein OC861_006334 [Tilletia horrida]
MKFSATLVAVSALVASVAADYTTVNADINTISSDITKLNSALQSTSGTSYQDAIAIDKLARQLVSDENKATSDVKATASFTTSQGQTILNTLNSAYTTVTATTKRLIALEPKFKSIGVASIAHYDISLIANATKTLGATLVSKAPTTLKSSASALSSKYNAALTSALAAYANDN